MAKENTDSLISSLDSKITRRREIINILTLVWVWLRIHSCSKLSGVSNEPPRPRTLFTNLFLSVTCAAKPPPVIHYFLAHGRKGEA